MTLKIGNKQERISPEDIALTHFLINGEYLMSICRTYAFNITSDTLPDREETQS